MARGQRNLVRVPVRIPKLIIDSLKAYNVNIPLPPEENDEVQQEESDKTFQDFLQEMLKGGAIVLAKDIDPPQQSE